MQPRHSSQSVSALATLREHTRDAHLLLHELEIFRALVAGTLDRLHYGSLLACLHDYYRLVDDALSAACARFAAHELGYAYQARTPLFAQDLLILGVDTQPRFAAAGVLPRFETAAALAGALYVVEGSLLGGAALDKAASRLLMANDSHDTQGRRYWAWCREVGALRWQTTGTLIERWVDTPARAQCAIAAARTTFTHLHGWLQPLAAGR